ncbi:nuclear transport factor 2 family protein [Actinomadura scrupuli]|uniref:nuclear transport factor 2 family protein n=1 Tax=Actinomadura scrupuli TaxID=559629 RepID=UPI003D98D88E
MTTKEFVVHAITDMTAGNDIGGAIERHFAPDFVQHSPICPVGLDGLRATVQYARAIGGSYTALRVLGDGDWAVIHARKTGLTQSALVLFNIYRVADGKVAEHWEAIQSEPAEMVGGRTMVDGATEITDLDRTEDNRELVRGLIENVYIGGDRSALADHFDGDALIQHNPHLPDGVPALRDALSDDPVAYVMLHRIIAEGNFVFTLSEGIKDGSTYVLYDMFRVADGKIVEHWDVVTELPAELPHDNGVF